ncbi:MAG: SDR family oxidoreductase [Thermodesulfobacteriota bacterium]
MRKQPGIICHNMGFRAKVINHLKKVPIAAGLEDHPGKHGCPGTYPDGDDAALPDEIKKAMIEGSYLKRMAQPEDIAKAILFLASDDAHFITGQLLLVDGGFSLK